MSSVLLHYHLQIGVVPEEEKQDHKTHGMHSARHGNTIQLIILASPGAHSHSNHST